MFEVQLPAFQGPLNLLLRLVEEAKLDITTVSLRQVTDQYLENLRQLPAVDPAELAEFIVIGAKLLYIKSCALLPSASAPAAREAAAMGEELTQMLHDYQHFREAAQTLRQREEQGQRSYPRQAPAPFALPTGLQGVTLEALLHIVQEALSRLPPSPPPEEAVLQPAQATVEEKIVAIEADLRRQGRLSFRALVLACHSRAEVVAAFLAVLELIKAQRLWAEQEGLFDDILLVPLEGVAEPLLQ